jgi:hypothetical protein
MSRFEDIFDGLGIQRPKDEPKPERGVRMVAKTIDGERYVRLADLVELLEVNGVLPGVAAKFRKSL